MTAFDAVALGIMWDRLIAVADEIVSTLVRTSFSTIVRESYDLSVVLFDQDGLLMAQGTYSVPVFIGTGPLTLRHMLARHPPESLRDGDILVTNDPWMGTGHTFDISVMRPVFRRGRLVGYTMTITHLPDVGGLGFSAGATEIFHEGLRLPICKLYRAGEPNGFLLELIRTNVRAPEQVLGDVMANVAANEMGGRALIEFMDEYGLEDLRPLAQAICAQSEQAMRAKIRAMRQGSFRNRITVEGIDGPVELACRVDVGDGAVAVDFAGTGPCVSRGINTPFCYAYAMALYCLKCVTVPRLPNNGGSARPVTATAPPGCIVHALPPAPVAARHVMAHFVGPLLFGALVQAVPDEAQADCGMTDYIAFQGRHPNGRTVSTIYFAAGGFGALKGTDGVEVLPGPSNMAVVPAEVWESLTGVVIERRALLPDSGGAGEARGGLGQEIVMRNATGAPMNVFCMGYRTEFPPAGFEGGGPGALREHRINGEVVHPKGNHVLQPGDRIAFRQAGGGGFGDPRRRPVEAVLADLRQGFVSPEGALRDYGVDARAGRRLAAPAATPRWQA
jgi:N-methylhydantoinase B